MKTNGGAAVGVRVPKRVRTAQKARQIADWLKLFQCTVISIKSLFKKKYIRFGIFSSITLNLKNLIQRCKLISTAGDPEGVEHLLRNSGNENLKWEKTLAKVTDNFH